MMALKKNNVKDTFLHPAVDKSSVKAYFYFQFIHF